MSKRPENSKSSIVSDPGAGSGSEASLSSWSGDDSIPESALDLVGMYAGAYELVGHIDDGAMGEVYRGRRRGRRQQWAVKVLRPTDSELEGIIQESISHPNVVRVDDFGMMKDRQGRSRPYIVMELMRAGSALHEWIETHNATIAQRCRLVAEAAQGVAYMHSLGYRHHDLKPSNILVDAYGTAKVADFGLAQLQLEAGYALAGGTYSYQSPEQCHLTSVELNEQSDVYGLGATLFSVLAGGRAPVAIPPGSTREEVYKRKLEHPPRLSLLASQTPPSVRGVIERALAPQREHRTESAAQFARELAQAVRDMQGLRMRMRSRCTAMWQRRPRLTSYCLAVLTALLATILLTTPVRHAVPYEAAFLSRLPAVDASLPAGFETVRMVRLPEASERFRVPQTAASLLERLEPDLRAESSLDRVQIAPVFTWRPMYAAFIDAMSQAGAKVITFDMFLPTERPEFDHAWAASIRRAHERGVPVVLGADRWNVDAKGQPRMSSMVWAARPRWGCLVVDVAGAPFVPLATGPPGELWHPSLALATYSAASFPDAMPDIVLRDDSVRLTYWKPGQHPGERVDTGVQIYLPALAVAETSNLEQGSWAGRQHDWPTAYIQRTTLDVAAVDSATLRFTDLLKMTLDERREAVAGRVLVVFDPYLDRKFDMQLERNICGGELHASAIEAMLQGRTARWARMWEVLLVATLAAGIAAAAGALVWGGPWSGNARHGLAFTLLLAILAAMLVLVDLALIWTYRTQGLILLPVAPALATVLGGTLCLTLLVAMVPRRKPMTELPNRSIQELLFPSTPED